MDPTAFPEAGSESASFIDEADLKDLKDPSILACFTNFIPDFLLLRITHQENLNRKFSADLVLISLI